MCATQVMRHHHEMAGLLCRCHLRCGWKLSPPVSYPLEAAVWAALLFRCHLSCGWNLSHPLSYPLEAGAWVAQAMH